jgi:hypothetical protein
MLNRRHNNDLKELGLGKDNNKNTSGRTADDAQALFEEEEQQEGLAKELLKLTSSLKHNFTAAGSVLKDDNAVRDFTLLHNYLLQRK